MYFYYKELNESIILKNNLTTTIANLQKQLSILNNENKEKSKANSFWANESMRIKNLHEVI